MTGQAVSGGHADCPKPLIVGMSSMATAVCRPLDSVPRYSLTRKEAAAALRVSVDTFERRVQPLIRVVVCGQLILVPPTELERWVRENAHFLV